MTTERAAVVLVGSPFWAASIVLAVASLPVLSIFFLLLGNVAANIVAERLGFESIYRYL